MSGLVIVWIVFPLIALIPGLITWLVAIYRKGRKYDRLKPRLDKIDILEEELAEKQKTLEYESQGVREMARQKAVGFPWLAEAYADFFCLQDEKVAEELTRKSHPAYMAAIEVRGAAQRRRQAEKTVKILKYQIAYYESLFPWLVDLKSEDIDDVMISQEGDKNKPGEGDPAEQWLTQEEYNRLPNTEKYQLALDRYWSRKKSKWEIGRDYERFVGYRYERQSLRVQYKGIIDGFDDLGRDLIVSLPDKSVIVVQCKCWSREKTIHEKHIFQLYGTVIAHQLDNRDVDVCGHFVTSTELSARARQFAEHLGIHVTEYLQLAQYPCIKCNISRRTGERIYHLPFDQQYDKTTIEMNRGEFFASTVTEAEIAGFRRAFRYRSGGEMT